MMFIEKPLLSATTSTEPVSQLYGPGCQLRSFGCRPMLPDIVSRASRVHRRFPSRPDSLCLGCRLRRFSCPETPRRPGRRRPRRARKLPRKHAPPRRLTVLTARESASSLKGYERPGRANSRRWEGGGGGGGRAENCTDAEDHTRTHIRRLRGVKSPLMFIHAAALRAGTPSRLGADSCATRRRPRRKSIHGKEKSIQESSEKHSRGRPARALRPQRRLAPKPLSG